MIRAITPPNLLGIDRRMAYIGKKYHSGWICVGVTKGLAGIKFSGSIKIDGMNKTITPRDNHKTKTPTKSLIEKYGWNFIISFLFNPSGLLEPVSWRNMMCSKDKTAIIIGNR